MEPPCNCNVRSRGNGSRNFQFLTVCSKGIPMSTDSRTRLAVRYRATGCHVRVPGLQPQPGVVAGHFEITDAFLRARIGDRSLPVTRSAFAAAQLLIIQNGFA